MREYTDLKEFWNKVLYNDSPEKIDEKWINDDSFNNLIYKYIKKNDNVLDYGSGSGWALIEIYNTIKIKGIGIDTSANGVNYSNECLKLSGIKDISFICGDEHILNEYKNHFDSCVSFNLLDVIPDDIIHSILRNLKESIKKDGYLIIGINPDFGEDFLSSRGFIKKDSYLYKDGILRCNIKKVSEWIKIFELYFAFEELVYVSLTENEKAFPRRVFILKNSNKN